MLRAWRNAEKLLLGLMSVRNIYVRDYNLREGMLRMETELVISLSGDKETSPPIWLLNP
jgi:hypothetical protein